MSTMTGDMHQRYTVSPTPTTIITVWTSDRLDVEWDKWGRMHHVVLHRRGRTYKAKHELRRIAVANAWAKSVRRHHRLPFWR